MQVRHPPTLPGTYGHEDPRARLATVVLAITREHREYDSVVSGTVEVGKWQEFGPPPDGAIF
jgi:hypothetical protein